VPFENPFRIREDPTTVNTSIERDCSIGVHSIDSAIGPLNFKGIDHILPNKFGGNTTPKSRAQSIPDCQDRDIPLVFRTAFGSCESNRLTFKLAANLKMSNKLIEARVKAQVSTFDYLKPYATDATKTS
jgi:hypothetical protein